MGEGLAGLRIGIPATRRADETAALVRRRGGVPVVGPVVTEVPNDDAVLREPTEAALATPPRWSIHLTGVGTRLWLDRAEEWGRLEELLGALARATIVARGAKTAKALRERGLVPAYAPPEETSGEIAAWLRERVGAGEVALVQRYGAPPDAVRSVLTGAGARIIEVAPYRWSLPADRVPAEELARAVADGSVDALIITSAPQAEHLALVAEGLAIREELRRAVRERVFVGVVGNVAAGGVRALGAEPDLVAEPARMGALVRGLAAARTQIIEKARPTRLAAREGE